MAYSYKQIDKNEVELLKALNAVFAEAFGEPDTYLSKPPGDDYLKELLTKEYFIAIAALAGEDIIGGLAAYELEKFEQERSEIYIYDLAVKEAHRRKGVATALINELQSVAGKRKTWVIFVQADRGDKPAIKLYESLGKRESVYHFDIPVPEKK